MAGTLTIRGSNTVHASATPMAECFKRMSSEAAAETKSDDYPYMEDVRSFALSVTDKHLQYCTEVEREQTEGRSKTRNRLVHTRF